MDLSTFIGGSGRGNCKRDLYGYYFTASNTESCQSCSGQFSTALCCESRWNFFFLVRNVTGATSIVIWSDENLWWAGLTGCIPRLMTTSSGPPLSLTFWFVQTQDLQPGRQQRMANGPSPGYFTAGWRMCPLCMVPFFHFSNFAWVGGDTAWNGFQEKQQHKWKSRPRW